MLSLGKRTETEKLASLLVNFNFFKCEFSPFCDKCFGKKNKLLDFWGKKIARKGMKILKTKICHNWLQHGRAICTLNFHNISTFLRIANNQIIRIEGEKDIG
jgi:hypothetical protein